MTERARMCGRAAGGAPSARSRIHHDVLQTIRGNTCAERQRVGSGSGRQYGAGRAGNGGREQTPPVMDIMAVAEQSGRWGTLGRRAPGHRSTPLVSSCTEHASRPEACGCTRRRGRGNVCRTACTTCGRYVRRSACRHDLACRALIALAASRQCRSPRPQIRHPQPSHASRPGARARTCGRRCIRCPTTSARAP